MAILMINYITKNLVSADGPGGYIMIKIPKNSDPELAFRMKILDNDRIDELGYVLIGANNNIIYKDIGTNWEDKGSDKKDISLLSCPNPECNQPVHIMVAASAYRCSCGSCGYMGPLAVTTAEAYRLHKAIMVRCNENEND